MKKRIVSILVSLALCFCMVLPTFATNTQSNYVSPWQAFNDNSHSFTRNDWQDVVGTSILTGFEIMIGGHPLQTWLDAVDYLKDNYGSTAINNQGTFAPYIPLVPNRIDVIGSGDVNQYLVVNEQTSSTSLAIVRDYLTGVTAKMDWYRHHYTVTVPKSGFYNLSFRGFLDSRGATSSDQTFKSLPSHYSLRITGSNGVDVTVENDSNSIFVTGNLMLQAGANDIRISGQAYYDNSFLRSYLINPVLKWSPANAVGSVSDTPFSGGGGKFSRGMGAGREQDKALYDPSSKQITNDDFIDEINNKLTLADGNTYDMSSWNYDYSTRTYNVITTDNKQISIKYGDTNVVTNITNSTGDTITYNYNYITINNGSGSSSTPSGGGSSSTPSGGGSSSTPSGGGSSSSTPTDPDTPIDPDKPDDGSNWFFRLLKAIVDGLMRILDVIFGGIINLLVDLITKLIDGILKVFEGLFTIIERLLSALTGGFTDFLKAFFYWAPPELVDAFTLMVIIGVILAIIRFFRGS